MADIKTIKKDIKFLEKMLFNSKKKLGYGPVSYELATCKKYANQKEITCDPCPLFKHMDAGFRCEKTSLRKWEDHHSCSEDDDHDYGGTWGYINNACEYCRQMIDEHITFLKKAVRVLLLK